MSFVLLRCVTDSNCSVSRNRWHQQQREEKSHFGDLQSCFQCHVNGNGKFRFPKILRNLFHSPCVMFLLCGAVSLKCLLWCCCWKLSCFVVAFLVELRTVISFSAFGSCFSVSCFAMGRFPGDFCLFFSFLLQETTRRALCRRVSFSKFFASLFHIHYMSELGDTSSFVVWA